MEKNEDTNIDEDLDVDVIEESGDSEESTSDDLDEEFEFDDEGNIIIPDETPNESDDKAEDEDDDSESKSENQDKETEKSEQADEPAKESDTPKSDENAERLAKLEAELNALKTQSRETLKRLGVETDDVMGGLEKLAADADDVPIEEYRKQKAATQRDDEARRLLQQTEFEKKKKADLAEVQAAYPELKNLTSIDQIENFTRFGELRDLGLSAEEAYAAANPSGIRKSVANAVKQQSLNETKNHMKTVVPVGSKDNSLKITKSELMKCRDLFPGKSDKELIKLYRQASEK